MNEYGKHVRSYGDVSLIPTSAFFFGPSIGEEFFVDIEPGKRLIIKFLAIGEARPNGAVKLKPAIYCSYLSKATGGGVLASDELATAIGCGFL